MNFDFPTFPLSKLSRRFFMYIVTREDEGCFILVPRNEDERGFMEYLANHFEAGSFILYEGRGRKDDSPILNFSEIKLSASGKSFVLKGDNPVDSRQIEAMGSICFHTGGLLFLGIREAMGESSVAVTGEACYNCGRNLINPKFYILMLCKECSKSLRVSFDKK